MAEHFLSDLTDFQQLISRGLGLLVQDHNHYHNHHHCCHHHHYQHQGDHHQDEDEGRILFSTGNITVNLIPYVLPIFSEIHFHIIPVCKF